MIQSSLNTCSSVREATESDRVRPAPRNLCLALPSKRGTSVQVVENGHLVPPLRTHDVRPPLDAGTWRAEGKPEQMRQQQQQGSQSHQRPQDLAEYADSVRAHA